MISLKTQIQLETFFVGLFRLQFKPFVRIALVDRWLSSIDHKSRIEQDMNRKSIKIYEKNKRQRKRFSFPFTHKSYALLFCSFLFSVRWMSASFDSDVSCIFIASFSSVVDCARFPAFINNNDTKLFIFYASHRMFSTVREQMKIFNYFSFFFLVFFFVDIFR